MLRPPPRSTRTATLVPYTPRFRSDVVLQRGHSHHREGTGVEPILGLVGVSHCPGHPTIPAAAECRGPRHRDRTVPLPRADPAASTRSEEHTSELQSLMRISYAVLCLKKKIHPRH